MKSLIHHIENLLPEHDCVVVPGLGGFVQNEISARFDPITDMFYPESKEICFNARLTFNDGFLAQNYQEAEGISFEESNVQIRQGVQEILEKIDEGKYVSLGRIGVMWKNEEGQLGFRSENKNFFIPDAYGLSSFAFPSMEKRLRKKAHIEHQEHKRLDEDFINFRLKRNSIRNLIAGAAACIFFVLLSKPAGNLPEAGCQQAYMLHDYIALSESSQSSDKEYLPAVDETITTTIGSTEETSKTTAQPAPAPKEPVIKKVEPKPEKVLVKNTATVSKEEKKVATPSTSTKTSDRIYYVIVSSFPERNLAESWIQKSALKNAGIIEKDGRARVYSKSFTNKQVAETYLNQFRKSNSEYASAWLLSAKNS